MLVTLGFIALIIGVILVVLGYTAAPQARMPGIILTVIGVVLVIVTYLIPVAHSPTTVDYDGMATVTLTV